MNSTMRKVLLNCAGIFGLLVVSCGISEVPKAGNSTQTGNGFVLAGRFFKPDGTTPAADALVEVRKKETIADITCELNKQRTDDRLLTATDDEGYYSFGTLPEGVYVVQGTDQNNNMVLIDSVIIPKSVSTQNLGDDTLLPPGTLIGSVELINGGFTGQIFILAFGLDRFCTVRTDGSFRFTSLPSGTYTFRILSLDPQYGHVDIEYMRIGSDSTTSIGSAALPLRELGMPELTAYYDTLSMSVTLSWSPVPGNAGYTVYRVTRDSVSRFDPYLHGTTSVSPFRRPDNLQYPLNGDTLYKDTFYIDNMLNGYKLPEGAYYVAAVDSFGNEWEMSEPAKITYYSPFQVVDTLYMEKFPDYDLYGSDDPMRVFVTAEDGFFFDGKTAEGTYCFSVYSENGMQLFRNDVLEISGQEEIKLYDQPFDSEGTYYFTRMKTDSVLLQTVTVNGEMGEIVPMISSDSQKTELPTYYRMAIVNDLVLICSSDNLVLSHYDMQLEEYVSWKDWTENDSAMFFEKYGTFPQNEYLISECVQLPANHSVCLISDSLIFTHNFNRTHYFRYNESGTVETGRVLPDFGSWINWTSQKSVVMFIPGGSFLKYAFVD